MNISASSPALFWGSQKTKYQQSYNSPMPTAAVRFGDTATLKTKVAIGLLTDDPKSEGVEALMQAAAEERYNLKVFDYHKFTYAIDPTSSQPFTVWYEGKPLPKTDIIISRMNPTNANQIPVRALHEQLETIGVKLFDPYSAIDFTEDKIRTQQLLVAGGLPMAPVSVTTSDYLYAIKDARLKVGRDVLIKLPRSGASKGVFKEATARQNDEKYQELQRLEQNPFYQKFSVGSWLPDKSRLVDYRCLVLDGKVIAAERRQSPVGTYTAGVKGNIATPFNAPDNMQRMAVKAMALIGLNFGTVDFLNPTEYRGDKIDLEKWLILEVNSCPSIKGFQNRTQVPIAKMLLQAAVNRVERERETIP